MWKRLPGRDRGNKGRQSLQIGAPTLLESTYDVQQLDRAQNLSPIEEPALSPGEAYYNAEIRPSRARQDAEKKLKLPTMNFAKHDPNDPTSYRPSVAASSVYSQPDDNISPPASPYRRPVDDDGRISPIDEHSPSGYGDLPRANKSQIPVARKITPRSKEWTQNVGKGAPMMWDDYSGEPTFDGAGKPSQVKPGEFDYRTGLKPVNKLPRPSAPSTQAQKTSFKEKATRLAKQGLAVDTRPPWKGGSGRHAIVDTPQDKPGQAPPQPKRVEESRLRSPGGDSLDRATSQNVAYTPETQQVPASYGAHAYPEHHASDITARNNVSSGRREYDSPTLVNAGGSPQMYSDPKEYPSPLPDRNATPTKEYPYSADATVDHSRNTHPALRDDRVQPLFSDESPQQRDVRNNLQNKVVQDSPDPNSGSRFSWTTTATSTYQQSIPPSPPPPMPTKYMNADSPASVKASVLDRGHPTRRLGTESPPMSARSFSAGSTLRKPVSSLAVQPPSPEPPVIKQQFPLTDWRSGAPKQRASSLGPSILSTTSSGGGKSLPKTPQELTSPDLIASLQAQQADLSLQRRNIQRLIADLEKPEAKNPVLHSFKVIREREKQLETLKGELADVIRRDHDLGMRLHRAWKRKERDDPNTPGSIFWVRRATAGT